MREILVHCLGFFYDWCVLNLLVDFSAPSQCIHVNFSHRNGLRGSVDLWHWLEILLDFSWLVLVLQNEPTLIYSIDETVNSLCSPRSHILLGHIPIDSSGNSAPLHE